MPDVGTATRTVPAVAALTLLLSLLGCSPQDVPDWTATPDEILAAREGRQREAAVERRKGEGPPAEPQTEVPPGVRSELAAHGVAACQILRDVAESGDPDDELDERSEEIVKLALESEDPSLGLAAFDVHSGLFNQDAYVHERGLRRMRRLCSAEYESLSD